MPSAEKSRISAFESEGVMAEKKPELNEISGRGKSGSKNSKSADLKTSSLFIKYLLI